MLVALAVALVLAAGPQSSSTDRGRAEQLARSGHAIEAMQIFVQLVEQNPGDIEARLWVAPVRPDLAGMLSRQMLWEAARS